MTRAVRVVGALAIVIGVASPVAARGDIPPYRPDPDPPPHRTVPCTMDDAQAAFGYLCLQVEISKDPDVQSEFLHAHGFCQACVAETQPPSRIFCRFADDAPYLEIDWMAKEDERERARADAVRDGTAIPLERAPSCTSAKSGARDGVALPKVAPRSGGCACTTEGDRGEGVADLIAGVVAIGAAVFARSTTKRRRKVPRSDA